MKIRIKLLSDLCTCSGETYNSIVDMDVVYDEYGIPYIPAKRIKGCIREAALEMVELGIIRDDQYEKIFGKEGYQSAKVSISNAYMKDYASTVSALKQCKAKGLKSPQNVLSQYTSTRTQTAVDMETGVADDNSLRTLRVVNKGLIFEADCDIKCHGEEKEILKQAVSLVKHMGMSRTRGLGLVDLKLSEEKEEPIAHVKIEKEQLGEHNKLHYQIHLKSALICKSAQGNQADTQDYIAGSKVLGLLVGALGEEKYRELMKQGEDIRVTNAYIMNHGKRSIPGRISLQKEKDQSYDKNGEMKVYDMLFEKDIKKEIKDRQMSPARVDYMDENETVSGVTTEISYHHQRPRDKSIGRATGKEDGSSFYQLCSISAGQNFSGYIYADRKQAEMILDAVENMGNVRMGYGRSSEFGAVDFEIDAVEKESIEPEIVHRAVITLASDVILYNENGALTTDLKVLKSYLEEGTGVQDIQIENPFLQFVTIGGFNVKWRRRKPTFYALGKGSTFLISSEAGVDRNLLNREFIGERVQEGYGEIRVDEIADTPEVCIRKNMESNLQENKSFDDSADIIQRLLQSEFERRMQCLVRERLIRERKVLEKQSNALNAAVAKLRIIYKTEKSYADMWKQIEGIEDGEKNGLCKKIVSLIDPEKIQKELQQEMTAEYGMTLRSNWTEELLYKKVYRAYITELKQFVRTVEKKGDTK